MSMPTLLKANRWLLPEVDSLYAIEGGLEITFTDHNERVTVTSPNIKPFYADTIPKFTDEQYENNKYGHIIAENINKYKLPKMLGGTTLSLSTAYSLVGTSPENIKAKVRTAGDMLMYMLAARMLLKDGDGKIYVGMANLCDYLLEGDYEEVGYILHSYTPESNAGGHVYNYIKYKGKYYIVDFDWYLANNYNPVNEFNVIALDKLEDYKTRWHECYSGLTTIIAHTSAGTHLPNVWEGTVCYYPQGSNYTLIMETAGTGYTVSTLPCPNEVPDWTKQQGETVVKPKPKPTPQPTPSPTVKPTPAPTPKQIQPTVKFNGKAVSFKNAPFIDKNNVILVPVDTISMILGATNKYDPKTKTVKITKGKVTIVTIIGSKTAVINKKSVVMPSAATLKNVPYIPLQFICERLGFRFSYVAKTKTASISSTK